MATNRRFQYYSGIRTDVPHLRSLESAVANDFDSVLRGMVTGLNQPYLLRGFDVVIPSASIQATSLVMKVADSSVLHSSASEAGTIMSVPASQPDEVLSDTNDRVIGSFQNGVANYISLDYRRITDMASIDQTAGWVPSENLEVQRAVPIASVLDYRFVISTSSFGSLLPLYIVGIDAAGFVTYITKAVPSLFRLGRGGSNPLSTFSFGYQSLLNPQTGNRREWINTNGIVSNSVSAVPGDDANAFAFGDWSIKSLKDWMDAVMTRFKEITGSNYWYIDTSFGNPQPGQFNLFDVWWDSGAGSVLTGNGNISFNIVLEATAPTSGVWQSRFTDSGITSGDSYVKGITSGTTGLVVSFTNNRLVINTVTNDNGFILNEPLEGRRIYRPILSLWQLDDDVDDGTSRFARMTRTPSSSASWLEGASWSFNGKVITITTTTPHGLVAGQVVQLADFDSTTFPPNGTHFVKSVPSTVSFVITAARVPTGAPIFTSINNVRVDNQTIHPYVPKFSISGWSSSGTTLTITAPAHTFTAPVTRTGTTGIGSDIITALSDTSDLAVGMDVSDGVVNIPAGTYITEIISLSSVRISNDAAVSGSTSITFSYIITLQGLDSTVSADEPVINSRFVIDNVLPNMDIEVTISGALAGVEVPTSDDFVRPDYHEFNIVVTDAVPSIYNVTDIITQAFSPTEFQYVIGPTILPPQTSASGAIQLDGVDAVSTVADPIEVKRIENSGSNVRVTTFVPHNETPGGPKTVTVYGDSSLSAFIRIYTNVTVSSLSLSPTDIVSITRTSGIVTVVTSNPHELTSGESVQISGSTPSTFDTAGSEVTFISTTSFSYPNSGVDTVTTVQPSILKLNQFLMAGSGLPFASTYINSGSDNTFLNFPNNPYPGPIEWDADIFIKGIIGDKYFKIPQSATASGTSTANIFNVDGQTGTAFLQDREVAYIVIERNALVSNGQNFSCSAGGPIVGSSSPLDIHSNVLEAGDFVRFDSDPESLWFRILNVSGNTINLISDYTGLTPDSTQRPTATGSLRYTKGTYDTVFVQPHYLVENSPNTYWIAVRRDNDNSNGQVYFRGLELRAGESVDIGNQIANNLLIYTGAGNEAATSPNYTQIDPSGAWKATETLEISDVNYNTHEVTFVTAPALGFQKDDRIQKISGPSTFNFTISSPLTERTVVTQEAVSALNPGDMVTYFRLNFSIEDPDNLTLAIRKEDRQLAKVNTDLNRPIYDESVYIQQVNMNGSGTVRSGSFIYKGAFPTNITALAWVLHGSANDSETIEGASVTMPGGDFGPDSILVHIYFGSFDDGDTVNQNGAPVGTRTVDNLSNPPFEAPSVPGDLSVGTEIVLPPNRRTQLVSGTDFITWPTNSAYRASTDPALAGEELLVVINDSLRQAELDYRESFGGPKGKIRIGRDLPENTRIRFRNLGSVGSIIASSVSGISLQLAYNAGNTIVTAIGVPVSVIASDFASQGTALRLTGNLEIDGRSGPNVINGIMGPLSPNVDQAFVIGKEANKPKEIWTALTAKKTQVAWDGSAWTEKTAVQVTTTSAPTVVTDSDIVVPDNRAIRVCMTLTGREATGLGSASYRIEGLFYREGGNVTLVGSPSNLIVGQNGSGTLTSFVFGITNPDTVQGVIIGHPTQTWYWTSTIEYQMVETSA